MNKRKRPSFNDAQNMVQNQDPGNNDIDMHFNQCHLSQTLQQPQNNAIINQFDRSTIFPLATKCEV